MTRKEKILHHIKKAIEANERCPSNVTLARLIKVGQATIYRDIAEIYADGQIGINYERGMRIVTIEGHGTTRGPNSIPRYSEKKRPEPPEHQRADNYVCSRCGCKNCIKHNPIALTSRIPSKYVGAW